MDWDLIVIGAGINGCGIARDAAMRGLSVLLLDKEDIGNATTSWSTRLIHGGLRYLEFGELGLVKESLRERETLLRIAPHLVRPLPLLIPIYRGNRRGSLTIRTGLFLYDILSSGGSLPPHRFLSPRSALEREPGLRREGLVGACLYFDGQVTFPERLALENALDAQTHGAEIRTHTRVTRILESDGVVRGVAYEDLLTGESGLESAPTVINVTGPWVDNTLAQSLSGETRLIGGTKGSHIVVEPFPDAPGEGLYVEAGWDGRPIFIIPWNGLYLIGTTDEKFEGNPDDAKVTVAEAVYLIDEANRVIPNAHLSERSVLYSYAGVRPLAFTEGGKPARISRRHFVHRHKLKGLFSIIGGKLTTYRSLAEKAVDVVQLERGMRVTASRTASTPLPGKLTDGAFSALAVEPSGIQARVTKRLRELYGARAAVLTKLAAEKPELAATLGDGSDVIGAEVPFAFREEMARTLIDFMMRRSMAGLSAGNVMAIARDAARVAEAELGWTEARARDELSSFSDLIKRLQRRPPVNVVATRWGF